jgi:hypothetical protein
MRNVFFILSLLCTVCVYGQTKQEMAQDCLAQLDSTDRIKPDAKPDTISSLLIDNIQGATDEKIGFIYQSELAKARIDSLESAKNPVVQQKLAEAYAKGLPELLTKNIKGLQHLSIILIGTCSAIDKEANKEIVKAIAKITDVTKATPRAAVLAMVDIKDNMVNELFSPLKEYGGKPFPFDSVAKADFRISEWLSSRVTQARVKAQKELELTTDSRQVASETHK